MALEKALSQWQLESDEQSILWLALNKSDAPVNSINTVVLDELDELLQYIQEVGRWRGLVIYSNKKTGFIAGADIKALREIQDIDEVMAFIHKGQAVFKTLSDLTMPTVAMIDGFCLGGGLELALACQFRVACHETGTRLGLPEVQLGIQPGWGGTVRLPQLIGAVHALPLLMSGKMLRAGDARRLGIVDCVMPRRQLKHAALSCIEGQVLAYKKPTYHRLFEWFPLRTCLGMYSRWQLQKRVQPDHYPAPFTVLDNWQHLGSSSQTGYTAEAESIASLFLNYTTKNLFHVFSLREKMQALSKQTNFDVAHVHVIGAGVMGADIASWCVYRGLRVTLQDRSPQLIAPAIAHAHQLLKRLCRDPYRRQQLLNLLIPDVEGTGVSEADVVIEAIIEDLKIKRAVLADVEKKAKPSALIASNTSSLAISEISGSLQHPERLIGIHFFNPVSRMPLVEIVSTQLTATSVVEQAYSLMAKLDKLPLPVNDTPGFLINRILSPYLMESVMILDEGVPASVIDSCAVDFGMPMGPIALADKVGLDICLLVATNLSAKLGGEVPRHLKAMVKRGDLGCKTDRGFYEYTKGKIKPSRLSRSERQKYPINEITQRLILRLLNEAAATLGENVVKNEDYVDAGMVFATGFAPFRGGPMQYAKSRGTQQITEQLQRLAERHGKRFLPSPYWSMLE